MRKDRLILLLLMTAFGLMAACDAPWDREKEEIRLPDRASPATALLRHYYDTRTFPRNMTRIKIPEGNDFDKKQLTVEMPMGGNAVVQDVRIRLFILPPRKATGDSVVDLMVRVISPEGTRSAWQMVDFFREPDGDADIAIDASAEVIFLNEFNNELSDGLWRIQLRDPIDDNDGRCVFRNATLRINGGLVAGIPIGGSETADVPVNQDGSPYEQRLPTLRGKYIFGDLGDFGYNAPMRLDFEFSNTFQVTGYALQFTIRSSPGMTPEEDVYIALVTPSGGWVVGGVPDPVETFDPGAGFTWSTFVISETAFVPFISDSFRFLAEPSSGTWTLLLWSVNENNQGYFLSRDEAFGGDLILDVPASLELA